MNSTEISILQTLMRSGEVRGTRNLARIVGLPNDVQHVRTCALLLYRMNLIKIERATAAPQPTIYRIRPELLQVQR